MSQCESFQTNIHVLALLIRLLARIRERRLHSRLERLFRNQYMVQATRQKLRRRVAIVA